MQYDNQRQSSSNKAEVHDLPTKRPHISVCVATYRRPHMLDSCIRALQSQEIDAFTYSIVVVDNDISESARDVVIGWQQQSPIQLFYDVEPVPNISNARNRAIKNAVGDLIAFVDDDELPDSRWLLNLVIAYSQFSADGVLGPVLPVFEGTPPVWLLKSGLCTRKSFRTGKILRRAKDMRSGNVLLGQHIVEKHAAPFDPRFGRTGGEDTEFFRRKLEEGRTFIWCNEARVYERVPVERQKLMFFVKRAFLLGATATNYEKFISIGTAKSIIAVIVYTAILPILVMPAYHLFVRVLIKDCHHGAKLLARLGVRVVYARTF